jgi:predicted NUDIX family NTP pyrophosphohydrolase
MPARSAGILLNRRRQGRTEVLLVHPGGPFWRNKDLGAWQLPKGEIAAGEDDEAAARREVAEELGCEVRGVLVALGEVVQAGGKTVVAFAAVQDFDPASLVSNTIEIEWPRRSGRMMSIPEVDEARWFDMSAARQHILPSQAPFLDRLAEPCSK